MCNKFVPKIGEKVTIGQPADEATRLRYVGKAYSWGRNGNPVRYVNA